MSPMTFNHGLNENQLRIIKDVLSRNVSTIEKVSLYGSRAAEKHKRNSDVDLVLYGDVDEAAGDRLWTLFYESLLPYKVDLVIYQHITHAPSRRRIDRQSQTLFTKDQLYNERETSP